LKYGHLVTIAISIPLLFFATEAFAQDIYNIPHWVKNNAKWWSQGKIGDTEFIKGIEYLVQNDIMKIPSVSVGTNHSSQIPSWIKNNARWWANDTISDSDFILAIQYLVSQNIIQINDARNDVKCDQFQTPAEKQTCQEQIRQESKLNDDIAKSEPHLIGPVTFYYIDSHLEPTGDGKYILTIHFIVKNTSNSEITMSCQRQDLCNYALYDGQKEIPYSANTLVYGSLTLLPNIPKYIDWTFYQDLDYQPTKDYSFLVKEPWGSGSIQLIITK